ncbi:MAG: serine/threonine-protein phosphatase [Rhodobacteraceae bacterium]|nr:serine/threonine-protein phosphatase [Paracoccaceae bacterium]
MLYAGKLKYDTATAISLGRREQQEDAIITDFPAGSGMGIVVLADGMGGHAAGDVASKIVVTEVFSELKLQSGDSSRMERRMGDILQDAAYGANECVGEYSSRKTDDAVMGATLLAPVIIEDRLFWISVGDSPLYLLRDGGLVRLNEDHAIGSQIEYLVGNGLMRREEALSYPDQNCLTSVIFGADIPQIDCPSEPFQLAAGDIVIAASDGLLVLVEERIAEIISPLQSQSAQEIGAQLMRAIEAEDDPFQDNVSFCVIKVLHNRAPAMVAPEGFSRPRMVHQKSEGAAMWAFVPVQGSVTG